MGRARWRWADLGSAEHGKSAKGGGAAHGDPLGALTRPPRARPYRQDIRRNLTCDVTDSVRRLIQLVKPIMKKHGWCLPELCEFFPKNECLYGASLSPSATHLQVLSWTEWAPNRGQLERRRQDLHSPPSLPRQILVLGHGRVADSDDAARAHPQPSRTA